MQGYGHGHAMDHGSAVVAEGKSPSHIPSIQSIPEEQSLQIPPRSPSIESDFPPTPGSPGSTGFNTAQALIEAGDCTFPAAIYAASQAWAYSSFPPSQMPMSAELYTWLVMGNPTSAET